MVRRFRPYKHYPAGFDASKLAANQSSVPSQHMPVGPAFDPSQQPDMQPTRITSRPDNSDVRFIFDSRPPYAYDFFFENKWRDGIQVLNPYTVPLGWVLLLKYIAINIYPFGPPDLLTAPTITPFGDNDDTQFPDVRLEILVDGSPTPYFTVGNVRLFDAFQSELEIPVFVPIQGGSSFDINITNVISSDGIAVTLLNTYVHFSGTMLLSTGRNLVNETGNEYPLPVKAVGEI